jgi:hypothetical protein
MQAAEPQRLPDLLRDLGVGREAVRPVHMEFDH